jgi:hypothetical protein
MRSFEISDITKRYEYASPVVEDERYRWFLFMSLTIYQ